MSRMTILNLSDDERSALEWGARHGHSENFRTRCRLILLKAEHLPSRLVAERVGCRPLAVNGWVKRYRADGIAGLETRPGRGRKAILDAEADREQVHDAVQNNCRRLNVARAELEADLGKGFSTMTLRRFLKNMAVGNDDCLHV